MLAMPIYFHVETKYSKHRVKIFQARKSHFPSTRLQAAVSPWAECDVTVEASEIKVGREEILGGDDDKLPYLHGSAKDTPKANSDHTRLLLRSVEW
jgi:hypothetical protein